MASYSQPDKHSVVEKKLLFDHSFRTLALRLSPLVDHIDHWHWVPGGEKQDPHYKPGDTFKTAVQVGAWGAAAAITIRVIITIGEAAAVAF